MEKILKNDFVNYYAEKNGTSRAEAKRVIDKFIDTFKEAVTTFGEVDIRGFLNAKVKVVPEREARNPRTGEAVNVPEKEIVTIKCAKTFRNALLEPAID